MPDPNQNADGQDSAEKTALKGDAGNPPAEKPGVAAQDPKADKGDGTLLDQAGDKGVKEEKKPDGEKPAEAAVPEKYELKAPEGMEIDAEAVEAFTPTAKELGLSQEGAQKVANVYAGLVAAQQKAQAEKHGAWLEEKKQETIKALGPKWQEEMAFAAKTRDRFFNPALMDLFNASGLSNDKDFNLALIKIGKTISEDTLVDGQPVGEAKNAADVLFPTTAKKN